MKDTLLRWLAADAAGWDDAAFALLAPFPAWVTAGVLVAAAGALGLSVWNVREAPPRRRALLVALRAGVVCLALALYLQPAIRLQDVTRVRNHLVLLLDGSRSMAVTDGAADDAGAPSRFGRVAALLSRERAGLEELAAEHVVDVLHFGDGLAQTALDRVAGLDPRGAATEIVETLDEVAERYRGKDMAGVVLLSDGADQGALGRRAPGEDLKARLAALGVPVHTVLAGDPAAFRDLAIVRVAAPEFAFVHEEMDVEVTLTGRGVAGQPVAVHLERDGLPIQSRTPTMPAEGGEATVRFSFAPDREGRAVLSVRAALLPGEAIRENNRRDFVVRVIRDKVRALQVAGHPSWDERFLRKVLKRNPNLDLISFFILRTSANLMRVPQHEMSLIPFPTRELFEDELTTFDVVILQDFDYRPFDMAQYVPRIADYVEGGGALLVIGGAQSFSAGGWHGTRVADVLPVELGPGGFEETMVSTETFQARLTDVGRRHPLTALSGDEAENDRLWRGFPSIEGVNLVAGVRAGAVTLVDHPALQMPDGRPHPVVVLGEHGRGRVMAVMTDSMWRLGLPAAAAGGDAGRLQRFWNNSLRWLLRDPEWKRLQVTPERDVAVVGEQVRVEVLALDRAYRPAPGVEIRLDGQPGPPLRTDADGRTSFLLEAAEAGVRRVEVAADADGIEERESAIVVFRAAGRELDDARLREDLLQDVAEGTGGRHQRAAAASLADLPLAEPRVLRVDRRKTVELWKTPWAVLLAVLLMGGEWWLRRRSGLL